MLVVFSSKTHGDITMFSDVAVRLLKMMGMSGVVPGAINAEDIPTALERLKRAIETENEEPDEEKSVGEDKDEKEEPRVSIAQRAFPLVEMLEAAAKADCHVMWTKR